MRESYPGYGLPPGPLGWGFLPCARAKYTRSTPLSTFRTTYLSLQYAHCNTLPFQNFSSDQDFPLSQSTSFFQPTLCSRDRARVLLPFSSLATATFHGKEGRLLFSPLTFSDRIEQDTLLVHNNDTTSSSFDAKGFTACITTRSLLRDTSLTTTQPQHQPLRPLMRPTRITTHHIINTRRLRPRQRLAIYQGDILGKRAIPLRNAWEDGIHLQDTHRQAITPQCQTTRRHLQSTTM